MTPWEPEAEDWLRLYAGTMPPPQLYATFRRSATRHGWHRRTRRAMEVKVKLLGLGLACEYDNLPVSRVARMLGINRQRVQRWVQRGLVCRQVSAMRSAVRVKDLTQFLREHPHYAWDISYDRLIALLEPEDARWVADHSGPGPNVQRQILCTTTGEVYRCAREAAKAHYVHSLSIYAAIRRGKPVRAAVGLCR